ncbi:MULTISPECIES: DNA recombination protein RmuC [unclassified Pseudonocardia]|uniref:DNA recombination protein RmuC n=1 Tax=unclassified Pseudonocardia TaxID=2619320 RepID=UPI00094AF701|nr:DNA recombination protein RmuC [Pseudonocardia sp. Ae707_Ps1]OLM16484.1 DNA recombination protein RmuC [Pseudonocardia sp. Ae707_Ps1]
MDVLSLLAGTLLGAALAVVVTWLVAAARFRAEAAEAARVAANTAATTRADAAGLRAERSGLMERIEELHESLDDAAVRARRAESDAAGATAALRAEREARAEAETGLKDSFAALSQDALARNNEAFVALAESRLKEATAELSAKARGDETARAKAVEQMLDPVTAALGRVEGQLRSVEKERESAYAGLREQVRAMAANSEKLGTETKALVNALRAPQVRGRWGEMQLQRVAEMAGMVEHCDFSTQVSADGEDGGVRPDMLVRLAGGKQVVVDAKVPFAAYLEAVEATDPDVHAQKLTAHARQLRTHVDQLAGKAYWESFEPTPEFVVLFVPGDPFLEAALRSDPGLLEHAFGRNVVLATPTTLVALLRTVAYGWKQEALARNAAQVHRLGRELHGRLATMGTHVAKLGRSLDSVVESYNRTVSSLEARVLVSARKFTELQVADTELEGPATVDRTPRGVSAPELVASAGDSLVSLEDLGRGDAEERQQRVRTPWADAARAEHGRSGPGRADHAGDPHLHPDGPFGDGGPADGSGPAPRGELG